MVQNLGANGDGVKICRRKFELLRPVQCLTVVPEKMLDYRNFISTSMLSTIWAIMKYVSTSKQASIFICQMTGYQKSHWLNNAGSPY